MSEADDIREFMGLTHKGKNDGKIRTYAEFIARLEKVPTAGCKRAATLVKMCAAGKIDVHELCDRLDFNQDLRSRLVRLDQRERRTQKAQEATKNALNAMKEAEEEMDKEAEGE